MATVTGAASKRNGQSESVRLAQDAVQRYLDESTTLGQAYLNALASMAESGLRAAYGLQGAAMQTSSEIVESMLQANRSLLDQNASLMRKQQEASGKLMAAGFGLMGSFLPVPRA